MTLLFTILVTFFAGMGAGLGTGFAGMSAAAVISPMLIHIWQSASPSPPTCSQAPSPPTSMVKTKIWISATE